MVCRPSAPTRSGRRCTTRVGVGRRAGPGAIPAWSCANANGAWSWSATLMRGRKKADRAGLHAGITTGAVGLVRRRSWTVPDSAASRVQLAAEGPAGDATARVCARRYGQDPDPVPSRYRAGATPPGDAQHECDLAPLAQDDAGGRHGKAVDHQSGRIEARTGLRMMPTFPRSPLSFRTAGFPQYGWKAGLSGGAFPDRQRLKPAPGMHLLALGLPSPFVHLRVGAVVPYCAGPPTMMMHRLGGWVALRPRGPRSGPGYAVPVRPRLTGPIRPTRRHIATSPQGGLYAMPSLCGSAEATRAWFRAFATLPS